MMPDQDFLMHILEQALKSSDLPLIVRASRQKAAQRSKAEEIARFVRESKLASFSALDAYGSIDNQESRFGEYRAKLITSLGDVYEGTVHRSDPQSGEREDVSSQVCSLSEAAGETRPRSPEDYWRLARGEAISPQLRVEAVHKLLKIKGMAEAVACYIADELAREHAPEAWTIALVFLAQDIHFPVECRASVRNSLLRIAHMFVKSTKDDVERAVWAALRRASSLLTPEEVGLLAPFLAPVQGVDARAVTLSCIEKLFLPSPPGELEALRYIGERANELAKMFLHPDVFSGGEPALLAQNAVCALAAIGDDRLDDSLASAILLGRRWLRNQLRLRLNTIRESWLSRGWAAADSPAYRNLESGLTKLD